MIDGRLAAISKGLPGSAHRVDQVRRLTPAEAIDVHVGRRLRARRVEIGLSQASLGRHLGLTFSQVQKYEKGSNRIGAGRLYHIASLLRVPVQYFFDGLEGPAPDAEAATVALAAEAARLQDAFASISDPEARQALLSLAASMADRS
jgi:transcriptional regulator with XRE-family HTH domain